MPLPNLPVPAFPNVPNLPGVPPVSRPPGESLGSFAITTVLTDAVQVLQAILRPQWGIFDADGSPIAVTDTVLSIEFRSDSKISSYPQESGGFSAINKVQMPYEARVQLVCSKSEDARADFLMAIDAAKKSTDLYRIVMPDVTYTSANVVGYDFRRTSRNGITMLVVEVFVEEVRQTVKAKFSKPKNMAASDPISVGQVQAQPPSAGQAALFGPTAVVPGSVPASSSSTYQFTGVQ